MFWTSAIIFGCGLIICIIILAALVNKIKNSEKELSEIKANCSIQKSKLADLTADNFAYSRDNIALEQ